MLILVLVKILATSITIGSGGSGDIFAPSLFLGAMTGGAFGMMVHSLFPTITASPGAYAIVGMAAVVSATTHGSLTTILMLFEMTGEYTIILPLMITCIVSTLAVCNLYDALQVISQRDFSIVPVVSSNDTSQLMGVISRRDIIGTYEKAVVKISLLDQAK